MNDFTVTKIERREDWFGLHCDDGKIRVVAACDLSGEHESMTRWRRAATQYVLSHPDQKYDPELLRALFPEVPTMDNFGIEAGGVRRRIEELQHEQNNQS